MPNDQAAEPRRLIGLENAVALPLISMIASLKKEVEDLPQPLVLQGTAPEAPGASELRLLAGEALPARGGKS